MAEGQSEGKAETILNILAALECGMENLDSTISPMLNLIPLEQLKDFLPPLEFAQYNAVLAYFLCSMYFVYLKLKGQDAQNHPIKQDLERVQVYMKKISAAKEPKARRKLMVNTEAARRVVSFYTDQQGITGPDSATAFSHRPSTHVPPDISGEESSGSEECSEGGTDDDESDAEEMDGEDDDRRDSDGPAANREAVDRTSSAKSAVSERILLTEPSAKKRKLGRDY